MEGALFVFQLDFFQSFLSVIVVQRAIPKSQTLEYLSLLDFGPWGNTQISSIGFSAGRNSNWTFYQQNFKFYLIGFSSMTYIFTQN